MKTLALSLLCILVVCAGCSTQYNMTLTNGDVITARGKPHLNADKNMWIFKDASGQTNFIPAANVSQVGPTSLANEDKPSKKFNPVVNK